MSEKSLKRISIFIISSIVAGLAMFAAIKDSEIPPALRVKVEVVKPVNSVAARAIAIDGIKRFEGLRLDAYLDGNDFAIGYGHHGVKQGQVCTLAEAEAWLRQDIKVAEDAIDSLVMVPISTGQRAALISFIFNFNRHKFKNSTLLSKLNAGKYNKVPGELERWVYGPDQDGDGEKDVLPGLQTRRAWEVEMWDM